MFKIRRKKKDQPTQDVQVADQAKLVAHAILKAVVMLLRGQESLKEYSAAFPSHRPALTQLIEAALTPPVPFLIEHARQHGLITDEEAGELIQGRPRAFDIGLKEEV